ncbi:MAG: alcohol dehydrogenase catalytic domain-containing protein [Candidatus Krumholzibacteria bacterium]|nr:alcohol dehydrogenase catalytic domain-containing protein [Candidatus Krumholzibacteria bacterium]
MPQKSKKETMRAAVYYNNGDVRIEERPIPKTSEDELLVRIESSGICGSDVLEWYRLKKAPLVLGHEIAGTVIKAGKKAKRFKEGDRVTVAHHVPCNSCRYCLAGQYSLCDTLRTTSFDPGGFCEYVRVPAINVDRGTFVIPDEISFDEGTFIEPLACVLRGLRIARFRPGSSVLVLGSGISGLLFIKLLGALGALRIVSTDIDDHRLSTAKRSGADAALKAKDATPQRLAELNEGRLFDLVVTSAGGTSVVDQALRSVDRGGTVLLFAPHEPGRTTTLPLSEIWRDQITIVATYAGPPVDTEQAIELLRAHRIEVNDMITHRLPLAETARGFRLVAEGKKSIKVIIKPQE